MNTLIGMLMNNLFYFFLEGNGFWGVQDQIVSNWIAPVFLIGVAIVAVIFIKNRQFRELGAFILIAAIVAVLVILGSKLFVNKNGEAGKLTNAIDHYVVDQIDQ